MAHKQNLKKHFEAILGRELADLSDGEILLRESTGLFSYEEGQGTSREIGTEGDSTKACGKHLLLSIGGMTATGPNGKAEFFISDFHCFGGRDNSIAPRHPIILVATAQSPEPVFVTTRTFIATKNDGFRDVKVELYTWEPGGNPARSKLVKWFCRFPFDQIIP
jgi:hypothetical protein